MERVCGNYYVTAARAKDKKDDGETRPSSNGSSKGGKKGKIGYRVYKYKREGNPPSCSVCVVCCFFENRRVEISTHPATDIRGY